MICGSAGTAWRIRAEACTASDSGSRSGRLRTSHIGIPDHSPTKTGAAGMFTQPGQLDHLIDPAAADPGRAGQRQQVAAGRQARVHGPGVQQNAELGHRGGRLGVVLAVDPHRPAGRPVEPAIIRIVVDFPAPFGPRKPVTTPGSTTKLKPSTAVLSPNRLVRPSSSIISILPSMAWVLDVSLRPGPEAGVSVALRSGLQRGRRLLRCGRVRWS